MWLYLVALAVVALTTYYLIVRRRLTFWRRIGVREMPGWFPFGSQPLWDMYAGKLSYVSLANKAYEDYPDEKIVGMYDVFGYPLLVVRDLDLAHHMLIKDFDYFINRFSVDPIPTNSKANKFFKSTLLFAQDDKWKLIRSATSRAYTSSRLKKMQPLVHTVCASLSKDLAKSSGQEIDVYHKSRDFTYDTFASTGYSVYTNSFENPKNPFKVHADKLLGYENLTFWKDLKSIAFVVVPKLNWLLDLSFFDESALSYFGTVIEDAVTERMKSDVEGNDLISIIVQALRKDQKESNGHWSHEEYKRVLVSNAIFIMYEGTSPVAVSLAIALYFQAKHQDVQEKLYQEIHQAIEEAGTQHLEYDAIQKLPYLDKVFFESIRAYRNLEAVERSCGKDYKIPGTDVIIPKGTHINIPFTCIMRDEKFYDNPNTFDPDHFTKSEHQSKKDLLTFGGFSVGPRGCIGMRYSLLTIKTALLHLVHDFHIVPNSKTIEEKTLEPNPLSLAASPKGGIWVSFEKRVH